MMPRISMLLQLLETQVWLRANLNQPMSATELRDLAKLLRYFGDNAEQMEKRLDGDVDFGVGTEGNVVSLREFVARRRPAGDAI